MMSPPPPPPAKKGDLVRLPNGTTYEGMTSLVPSAPFLPMLLPKSLAILSSSATFLSSDPLLEGGEVFPHGAIPGGVYGIYLGGDQWVYHSGTAEGEVVYGTLSPQELASLEVVRPLNCQADLDMIQQRIHGYPRVAFQDEGEPLVASSVNSPINLTHAFKWTSVRACHIKVDFLKGMATHHGIDLGDGRVVHYVSSIRCDPLWAFMGTGVISLTDRPADPHHADDILSRAMQRVGEQAYNCVLNNCEHFCNWCFTGEAHVSYQVSKWVSGVGTAVGAALACSLGSGLGVFAGVGASLVACPTGALLAHNCYMRKALHHTEQCLTQAICQRSQAFVPEMMEVAQ